MNTDWKIYFEKGKVDEQIRNLSNKFYNHKNQIIKQYNSKGIKIFENGTINFSTQFESFLIYFFKNDNELEKINFKQNIYDRAYNLFKKRLRNNLIKRINERIICTINFSDGYSLYQLFEAFKKIGENIIFRINLKEIQAYTTNESKTCLMRVVSSVKICQIYYNERLEISLNLNDLTTLLKCRKSDLIQTQLKFKEGNLDLELYSKKNKSKINRTLKSIEEYINEDGILDELLNLEHSGLFEIDSNKFNYFISQSGRLSEAIKLILTRKSIIFSEENSISAGDIEWNKDVISNINLKQEVIIVYFSINYFKIFSRFLFETNPKITLILEHEIPLKIQVNFSSLENSYGEFFIAQRDPF